MMMMVRLTVFGLLLAGPVMAAGVPLVDGGGGSHGSVNASLSKGVVKDEDRHLPALPGQPTGASFTAYVSGAYLASSADAAVEIFPGRSPERLGRREAAREGSAAT
jgi:hypothetical protein